MIRLLWSFFANNDILTCWFNLGVWVIGATRRDILVAIELYLKVKHGRHAEHAWCFSLQFWAAMVSILNLQNEL